jgi:hypothetical protein
MSKLIRVDSEVLRLYLAAEYIKGLAPVEAPTQEEGEEAEGSGTKGI